MSAATSALSWRQQRAYRHTCAIVAVTTPRDPNTGVEGDDTYTLVALNVRYKHFPTRNLTEPSLAGKQIEQNIDETDRGRFPLGVSLPADGFIYHTTPGGALQGLFFKIEGPRQPFDNQGIRRVNESIIDMRWEQQPHPDLRALVAGL